MIYHMTTKQAWAAVDPEAGYRPESLETEEFIHLSTVDQIEGVANRYYRGQQDSIILKTFGSPSLLMSMPCRIMLDKSYAKMMFTLQASERHGEKFCFLRRLF